MPDNCIEDALDVVNQLEAADTLEGYRGARKILALVNEYEIKALDSEVWHGRFKEAMVRIDKLTEGSELHERVVDSLIAGDTWAIIQEFIDDSKKWKAAEVKIIEALKGCKYCKLHALPLPYCQRCLESIAKASARPI